MAPPKPSQRGKFRPKKPQKKASRVDTASAGKVVSTSSLPPSATPADRGEDSSYRRSNSSIDERGRGRGGRGRGRGGRGRGGRGRIPIPQGTVFFTGGEKKKDASATRGSESKRKNASASSSRSSKNLGNAQGKDGRDLVDMSTEEVVGQLDTAIGGSGSTKKESILEKDYGDYHQEEEPSDGARGSMNMNITAGCLYDSDSSDERTTRVFKNTSLMAPLELPFALKSTDVKPDETNSNQIDENVGSDSIESNHLISPFAGTTKVQDLRDENNSWFLVQLPTRLPPMQKEFSCSESDHDDTKENDPSEQTIIQDSVAPSTNSNFLNHISEVAVSPVTTSCFDNSLNKKAPGRVGKIVVYKSGKTVLVMDGPDDKVRPKPWWIKLILDLIQLLFFRTVLALTLSFRKGYDERKWRPYLYISPTSCGCGLE